MMKEVKKNEIKVKAKERGYEKKREIEILKNECENISRRQAREKK